VVDEADDGEERSAKRVTEHESEVLRLASTGMINKEIAERVCLSVRTVRAYQICGPHLRNRG
jgi:DNA-binding NarL/FixJ family response regulator